MKRPDEVSRLYKKTDEEVLMQSDVLLCSFQANKSLFIERFPELADPFALDWRQTTATARVMPPDYVLVAEQTRETIALETLMGHGRNLFQTVIVYTHLAFPGKTTVLQLFGQPKYRSIRSHHIKLPLLLRSTYVEVSKPEYKPFLMNKGLMEQEIELLDTLAESIILQTEAQQNSMRKRTLAASERIAIMNAIWEKMTLVCQCAKLVFQNNAALYNLFLLNDDDAA